MDVDPSITRDVQLVGRITAVPKILHAVTHVTGLRFAAVARVTDQSWTACAVHDLIAFGLQPGGQLPLQSTFCNEIRQHHQPVIFSHASTDPRYRDHPAPKGYGFESYVSIPIFRTDGQFFGTLCALDILPVKLDEPGTVRTLELFAELIGAQVDLEEQLETSTGALHAAEDVAKLRDQFIAVLGHDLRNPLQSLAMGTDILRQALLEPRWTQHLDRMQRSSERMTELIENILDFARGRLGGGIALSPRDGTELLPQLQQVISEVQSAYPSREIVVDIELQQVVQCDERRIAQLLGNLLHNAVRHGADDQPVTVRAHSDTSGFKLSVTNQGRPIDPATMSRLFEPFWRATPDQSSAALGLGLGLYIAAEIAKAHAGALDVSSSAEAGTRFEFSMPAA